MGRSLMLVLMSAVPFWLHHLHAALLPAAAAAQMVHQLRWHDEASDATGPGSITHGLWKHS